MTGIDNLLHPLFGAVDGSEITSLQMAARAVLVYLAVIIIVRLGKQRFLGRASAFDMVVGVILGAVAGRAVSGSAPVIPSLAACAAMVALHWLFSRMATRSHTVGRFVKGETHIIVRNGEIDETALHRCHLSIHDLEEELRHHNIASLDRVAEARLERSGTISILTKDA